MSGLAKIACAASALLFASSATAPANRPAPLIRQDQCAAKSNDRQWCVTVDRFACHCIPRPSTPVGGAGGTGGCGGSSKCGGNNHPLPDTGPGDLREVTITTDPRHLPANAVTDMLRKKGSVTLGSQQIIRATLKDGPVREPRGARKITK